MSKRTEPQNDRAARLNDQQRDLAARHLAMVGLHMKRRVPTPRQPTRDRDYDDLFQEGCIGLLRAAARFRAEKDGVFAAFAIHRIRGAVHTALHEQFSAVRVPASARRPGGPASGPPPARVEMPVTLLDTSPGAAPGERIRHQLRRRFERAVRLAVRQLHSGVHATPHRNAAIEAIANQRILIASSASQTPLRRIAREHGISSSRACAYEQRLLEIARLILSDDPRTRLLVEFARGNTNGFDAPLDADQLARLDQADADHFHRRFTALDRARCAQVLADLIEASGIDIAEVAVNLYRMLARRDLPIAIPA